MAALPLTIFVVPPILLGPPCLLALLLRRAAALSRTSVGLQRLQE